MSSNPSFTSTLKKEFLHPLPVLAIVLISFLYFSFSVLILNVHLVTAMLMGSFPLSFKFNLVSALVLGAWEPLGPLNTTLLIFTSLLVGINTAAVIKNLKKLKRSGGALTLSVGGSAIIGIFVTGCSTCGFSVFALLGLTAAVSIFPFEGTLIGLLIIVILIASTAYSLRTLHRDVYCKLDNSGNKEDK